MTKEEARTLLDADKLEHCLEGWDYVACVEELLPNHCRRPFRLAFDRARVYNGAGVRASADQALQQCQRVAGAEYAVGNGQRWRA